VQVHGNERTRRSNEILDRLRRARNERERDCGDVMGRTITVERVIRLEKGAEREV